ncbi:MAG TPA: DMT family transporter [Noviherbaspirillum sp.]|uniref:DMT family transporter n=1 Tax=Noviherbaspirillum sp. TaxID=1926288 RepID=UPI002DDCA961|nr:DMT family transporter [Noviherbaspirillum sp.]HEV2609305.1 DMT family transporter [Noviherbaspirillum sp.]
MSIKQPAAVTVDARSDTGRIDSLLAWYFVIIWGSGYLASKTGMQYAAPFTFLTLRYTFGILCLLPWVMMTRPSWPSGRREFVHICVAGLLMHAINLGGSHHAQYLGMSAGVTALLLSTQPLLTAVIAHRLMGERLNAAQWLGVVLGLAGVMLVVWHKIDVRAVTHASLFAAAVSLTAITAGTLYQRAFCKTADLRSAAFLQFVVSLAVLAPLAWINEGMAVRWSWPLVLSILFLVVLASILAVNALHVLMRRGQATKVTSLFFLTPIVAVLLEWMMFGVVPTLFSIAGIAVTCAGVALVSGIRR